MPGDVAHVLLAVVERLFAETLLDVGRLRTLVPVALLGSRWSPNCLSRLCGFAVRPWPATTVHTRWSSEAICYVVP